MKIEILTEVSWYVILDAIDRLANEIADDRPTMFAFYDAERLEAVARLIRSTIKRLENP